MISNYLCGKDFFVKIFYAVFACMAKNLLDIYMAKKILFYAMYSEHWDLLDAAES